MYFDKLPLIDPWWKERAGNVSSFFVDIKGSKMNWKIKVVFLCPEGKWCFYFDRAQVSEKDVIYGTVVGILIFRLCEKS